MLKTRVITAVFLIIGLLLTVFFASNQIWAIVTLGVSLLAINEWCTLISANKAQSFTVIAFALILSVVLILLPYTAYAQYQPFTIIVLLSLSVLFWIIVAPFWLYQRKVCKRRFMMGLLGGLLIIATWIALVGLHQISPWLLMGALATVSVADSAAYFAGKRFGRRKLAPNISPGKTWEGVFGAIFAVTLYGGALCYYLKFNFAILFVLWVLVAFSIIGDLVESLMKRQAGVKDSGQLLPGHGGILDRIDGFIPTLPMVLLCIVLSHFSGLYLHG